MANLLIIKDLADKKNISLKDLALQLGITPDGLQKIMKRNSTTTETVEKLAQILGVQAGIFFEGYNTANQLINGNGNTASVFGNITAEEMSNKNKEIEHLKDLLAEKERVIEEKERLQGIEIDISLMKHKANNVKHSADNLANIRTIN